MEIECDFLDGPWWSLPETVYTCYVTSCNITDRGSAVSAFKGGHKAGKNHKSVKGLWFKDTKVHYIPRNLTKVFPNLVFLSIWNCELKEVSAEDLIGLEKLEYLYLPQNKITTLPLNLFKNMKDLKKVYFNDNLIQKFDATILEPIKDTIENFGISSNPGVSEVFKKKKAGIDYFIEHLRLLESKKIESQRLDDLFSSDKYSDFTIKVQDKEFRVHKNVLAIQSSVFHKMLSDDVGATSETFDIGNFSLGAVDEFLRYFYTRTAPSEGNATDIMQLAKKFDVPDLKLKCEAVLVQTIEPESSRQLFNLAVQNSLPRLKRKSFEAIKERHPEVGEYVYDEPDLVNRLIDAKDKFEAKKMKLKKKE